MTFFQAALLFIVIVNILRLKRTVGDRERSMPSVQNVLYFLLDILEVIIVLIRFDMQMVLFSKHFTWQRQILK